MISGTEPDPTAAGRPRRRLATAECVTASLAPGLSAGPVPAQGATGGRGHPRAMTMDERYRRGEAVVRRPGWAGRRQSRWPLASWRFWLLAAPQSRPLVAGRGLIQDLFLILTMLTLAQDLEHAGRLPAWSRSGSAFPGLGAYAMFALVLCANTDPLLAIALAGLAAGLIAIPVTYMVFRLHGAYFAVGTWVVSEVFRLLLAQVKTLGGGTGTALPKSATNDAAFVTLVADPRTFGPRSPATWPPIGWR